MIKKIIEKLGYKLTSIHAKSNIDNKILSDNPDFANLYAICKPYSMTSVERMFSLYSAVEYILKNKLEGDFVECGVWKGGSSMMIALLLKKYDITDKKLYMYDTYEGMSEPDENDKDFTGVLAKTQMENASKDIAESVWCYSSLDEVKQNMQLTKFNLDNVIFIVGKVEDTIPATIPNNKIALLRLDTDFYASTKQELEFLYPKLITKGVLIIDDYGHWQGCRKAVDDYFKLNDINLYLNIIDYTGRSAVKN
jgi:O-methyltransferase